MSCFFNTHEGITIMMPMSILILQQHQEEVDLDLRTYLLGLGGVFGQRSRSWNSSIEKFYKKKNSFGFSSQVGEVLALNDRLYFVFVVSLLFMLW